jgi:DNA-binding CsgD family transcriptional regulator
LSVERDRDEIAIAIDVKDATLADRLSRMLGDVASVRLVKGDERADAVIVTPGTAPITADVVQLAEDEHSAVESKALTPREREVLVLLAEGATNKTIARRLGISVHTAKFHVGSLIDKLDAAGRTDAVAHAARLGVIVL